MQDFVVFDHVCKTYQMGDVRIDALKDASFTIAEGEICVIVGQSGAGKTTLLNILGGMDSPPAMCCWQARTSRATTAGA